MGKSEFADGTIHLPIRVYGQGESFRRTADIHLTKEVLQAVRYAPIVNVLTIL